jgi:murein DD-endopeptidase MepM/ murein hydrolase activator NlpD
VWEECGTASGMRSAPGANKRASSWRTWRHSCMTRTSLLPQTDMVNSDAKQLMSESFVPRLKLLLTVAIVFGILQVGHARERGPRIEVVCPSAPIPVEIGDHKVLVYELHVTNFDKVPLTLSELETFANSEKDQLLLSASGDELRNMIHNVGSTGKATQTVDPGKRAVIFVQVELGIGIQTPRILRHRMTFLSGVPNNRASAASAGSTARSILDSFPVAVSGESVPVLSPPFQDGVWVAGDGPSNASGHRRALLAIDGHVYAPERFASDWVKVGPNGDSHRGTAHNKEFWAYGQPILAVADGEVTQVVDGIPDNTPRVSPAEITLDNIVGNYIVLRITPNRYVTYAHLQPGSIKVTPRQRVVRGEVIARLGNSGQSTAPHLHLQVTAADSALESEGVPFVFDAFVDFGPGADYELDKHQSIPRQNSLPPKDEVVEFKAADRRRK